LPAKPLRLVLILDSSSCGTKRRGDGELFVAESLTGLERLDFREVSTGSTANRRVTLAVDSGCSNCRLGGEGEDAIADRKVRVDNAGADTLSQT